MEKYISFLNYKIHTVRKLVLFNLMYSLAQSPSKSQQDSFEEIDRLF